MVRVSGGYLAIRFQALDKVGKVSSRKPGYRGMTSTLWPVVWPPAVRKTPFTGATSP